MLMPHASSFNHHSPEYPLNLSSLRYTFLQLQSQYTPGLGHVVVFVFRYYLSSSDEDRLAYPNK